jgi:hypothetical protein
MATPDANVRENLEKIRAIFTVMGGLMTAQAEYNTTLATPSETPSTPAKEPKDESSVRSLFVSVVTPSSQLPISISPERKESSEDLGTTTTEPRPKETANISLTTTGPPVINIPAFEFTTTTTTNQNNNSSFCPIDFLTCPNCNSFFDSKEATTSKCSQFCIVSGDICQAVVKICKPCFAKFEAIGKYKWNEQHHKFTKNAEVCPHPDHRRLKNFNLPSPCLCNMFDFDGRYAPINETVAHYHSQLKEEVAKLFICNECKDITL